VAFTFPSSDTTVTWKASPSYFSISVSDPEQSGRPWLGPTNEAKLVLTSDVDGEICNQSATMPWQRTYQCPRPVLALGHHKITATATDPFGAVGTASVRINVVNHAPTTTISLPATGSVHFADQTIQFRGLGFDVDESLPDAGFKWTSDVDGFLGTGRLMTATLSRGTHIVTLTVTDAKGQTGVHSITLNVRAGAGRPSAVIVQPVPLTRYGEGDLVPFEGFGVDRRTVLSRVLGYRGSRMLTDSWATETHLKGF
jgi:hypothetical protein